MIILTVAWKELCLQTGWPDGTASRCSVFEDWLDEWSPRWRCLSTGRRSLSAPAATHAYFASKQLY